MCIDFFGTITHFFENVLNPFVLKLLLKKAQWKLCKTLFESSTGLPFVPGEKYKLPKFGHPQKIKVWLLGLNKTRLPWQLPLLSFFTACYTFLARFCYFTFWYDRFLEKLLRILRVHEGSGFSLYFSGQFT